MSGTRPQPRKVPDDDPFKGDDRIRVAIITRNGTGRSQLPPQDPDLLLKQRKIAQEIIERCVGPVNVVKHCHQEGSAIEGVDEHGRHRLWQQDMEKIFKFVHILVIWGYGGLAADNQSLYTSTSYLPLNSLVSWIFGENRIFFMPPSRVKEHAINPRGFFDSPKDQIAHHPFLQLADIAVAEMTYEKANDVRFIDPERAEELVETGDWSLGEENQDPPVDYKVDGSFISVLFDVGNLPKGVSLELVKLEDYFLQTNGAEAPLAASSTTSPTPARVLAFEDGDPVPAPLSQEDVSIIGKTACDKARSLSSVMASYAKRDGGKSLLRDEQINKAWSRGY